MSTLYIRGGCPIRGRVRVPGDKSIGHRALLFSALAEGRSRIHGLSHGEDNVSTARALEAMGVKLRLFDGGLAEVHGVGLRGLRPSEKDIDCGNSGTSMRLFTGLLAAQHFRSVLTGDASLRSRPMRRVVHPLVAQGARIAGAKGKNAEDIYPPLVIEGMKPGEQLKGINYDMPVASAQVKTALLLGGLYASGPTVLKEPLLSRDHTERMFLALGVPIETAGSAIMLDPRGWRRGWDAVDWSIPSDLSSAAFVLALARLVPDSHVELENVGVNPTRTGFLDAMRLMGANIVHMPKGDAGVGEPVATLQMSYGALRGILLGGELLTRMIDEVPIACALGAHADGTTEIRDAAELRVKESDRISSMAETLAAFGIMSTQYPDGLRIEGGQPRAAARVNSHGDHRIAMTAAVLAMATEGESVIEDVGCIETSFPGFTELMRTLGAGIEQRA